MEAPRGSAPRATSEPVIPVTQGLPALACKSRAAAVTVWAANVEPTVVGCIRTVCGGYTRQTLNNRVELGLAVPPLDRPKRPPEKAELQRVGGKWLRDFDDLKLEWDWDFNGDLDPTQIRAGWLVSPAWITPRR